MIEEAKFELVRNDSLNLNLELMMEVFVVAVAVEVERLAAVVAAMNYAHQVNRRVQRLAAHR